MNLHELLELRTNLERFKKENLTENREVNAVGSAIILIGDVILRMERDDKWRSYVERVES